LWTETTFDLVDDVDVVGAIVVTHLAAVECGGASGDVRR